MAATVVGMLALPAGCIPHCFASLQSIAAAPVGRAAVAFLPEGLSVGPPPRSTAGGVTSGPPRPVPGKGKKGAIVGGKNCRGKNKVARCAPVDFHSNNVLASTHTRG